MKLPSPAARGIQQPSGRAGQVRAQPKPGRAENGASHAAFRAFWAAAATPRARRGSRRTSARRPRRTRASDAAAASGRRPAAPVPCDSLSSSTLAAGAIVLGSPMSRVAHPAGPRHADVLPPDHPPPPPADVNALDPVIWPRTARRVSGALTLGGMDARALAARFGTPVFACDEADFRERCRDFRQAFGDEAGVFYAAKAVCCRAVLRWVSEEGLGVDVCTGGELEVALQAGVEPEMITMHGSNKLTAELDRAVSAGVGHIVVDSFDEIGRLATIAEGRGGRAAGSSPAGRPKLLVRVTTGVEAAAHEFVATAH